MQNWSSRFVVAQASSTSEPMAIIPDLRGKVVLITGAGTGIGAAAAHAFGRNGAKIAINYRQSQTEAEQVADAVRQLGGEALLVQKDVILPEAASEIGNSGKTSGKSPNEYLSAQIDINPFKGMSETSILQA